MVRRVSILLALGSLFLAGAWSCAPQVPAAPKAVAPAPATPPLFGLWFYDDDRNCAANPADPALDALVKALAPPEGGKLLVLGDLSGCISKALLAAAGPAAELHAVVNYAFEALEIKASLANSSAGHLKIFLNDYGVGPSTEGPIFPGAGDYDLAVVVGFSVSGPEDLAAGRPLLGAKAARVVFLHPTLGPSLHPDLAFSPGAATRRLGLDGPGNPLAAPVEGDHEGVCAETIAALRKLLGQPDLLARANTFFNTRGHTGSELGAFMDDDSFYILRWLVRSWPLLDPDIQHREVPPEATHWANGLLLSAYFGLSEPDLRRYQAVRANLPPRAITDQMLQLDYQPLAMPSPFANRILTAFRRD